MRNKLLSYIGLAMRAGKVEAGDEKVLKAVRGGQACLVFIASDGSDNARKKYMDKCSSYHVPVSVQLNRTELGSSIGKEERVVLAITDRGFARMMENCLKQLVEVENIE